MKQLQLYNTEQKGTTSYLQQQLFLYWVGLFLWQPAELGSKSSPLKYHLGSRE